MKEYIFTKDYKLIGEENLEIEIEEQDSLIKVEFEELETAPQEYVVSVSSNGNGSVVAIPHIASKGDIITLVATPDEGYRLSEYEVLSGGVVIENNRFILGNSDVSIRANFEEITYTVSFNMQGYGTQIPSETVGYESTATEPTAPTDTGAIFKGWYTESKCINEYNFDVIVYKDIVLYAKWDVVCLTFTSNEPFTLKTNNLMKNWDGELQYSTDKKNWDVWNGESVLNSIDNSLYLRGIDNTVISGNSNNYSWVLVGNNISCLGNIETLINYPIVTEGEHVVMGNWCYAYMFSGCTSLITPPELPATTLVSCCYDNMFASCTSLTTPPQLPATTLAKGCYNYMFQHCYSLTTVPELPATTLATGCYQSMFAYCTSLTIAPELPATTLANSCYSSMFFNCTSLITPPELQATTLADWCYFQMFTKCHSLVSAPALPATTLANRCYVNMFYDCTSLTTTPELPATTLASHCYDAMFYNCTSLTTAPELPAITLTESCYSGMFYNCMALTTAPELPATTLAKNCYKQMFTLCTRIVSLPKLPAINLADYCYQEMFKSCSLIKLSETQDADYTTAYRIPTEETGTDATNALTNMFTNTGGTFKGTPTINTTYYLHKDNSIVS